MREAVSRRAMLWCREEEIKLSLGAKEVKRLSGAAHFARDDIVGCRGGVELGPGIDGPSVLGDLVAR